MQPEPYLTIIEAQRKTIEALTEVIEALTPYHTYGKLDPTSLQEEANELGENL